MVDDPMGVSHKDFPGEGRATVLRDANNVTSGFLGFARKARVNSLVVHLFPEVKAE